MRLCRFIAGEKTRHGVIDGGDVFEIDGYPYGQKGGVVRRSGGSWRLDDVRLVAPSEPSKIIAIGLNYRAHAAEFNKALPEEPMIFLKPPSAVIGPGDSIVYPSHMSRRVDYEGELALVIGRMGKDVPRDEAASYVLGYTCFNDVTARDLQGKDIQYTRAKGFDTFASFGPWIETDINPMDVRIETFLNGERRQDTRTSDMIFDVFHLLSFCSYVMTLMPGDVITTGTPSGIGKMKPNDVVEVVIEGIGRLDNTVVARA